MKKITTTLRALFLLSLFSNGITYASTLQNQPSEAQTLVTIVIPEDEGSVKSEFSQLDDSQWSDNDYFIRLDTETLRALQLEEHFYINFSAKGQVYKAVVKKTSSYGNIRQLTGTLTSQQTTLSQGNTFSITLSAEGSVANFAVEGENYMLTEKGGLGWIKKQSPEDHTLHQSETSDHY
jgi:hypothetical protein